MTPPSPRVSHHRSLSPYPDLLHAAAATSGSARPLLLCLDMQQEHAIRADPFGASAILACRRVLDHARRHDWDVAHSMFTMNAGTLGASTDGEFDLRPASGFEPKVDEAVYERCGLSAFSCVEFSRHTEERPRGDIFTIGFAAPLTMLATAFAAYDRRTPLTIVGDALAPLRVDGVSPAILMAVSLSIARLIAPVRSSDEIVTNAQASRLSA